MKQKTFDLTEPQLARLAIESKRSGQGQAELVRTALEMLFSARQTPYQTTSQATSTAVPTVSDGDHQQGHQPSHQHGSAEKGGRGIESLSFGREGEAVAVGGVAFPGREGGEEGSPLKVSTVPAAGRYEQPPPALLVNMGANEAAVQASFFPVEEPECAVPDPPRKRRRKPGEPWRFDPESPFGAAFALYAGVIRQHFRRAPDPVPTEAKERLFYQRLNTFGEQASLALEGWIHDPWACEDPGRHTWERILGSESQLEKYAGLAARERPSEAEVLAERKARAADQLTAIAVELDEDHLIGVGDDPDMSLERILSELARLQTEKAGMTEADLAARKERRREGIRRACGGMDFEDLLTAATRRAA